MEAKLHVLSLFLLVLCHHGALPVCPGDAAPPVPLRFGFMTAVDPRSDYVLAGIIPSVNLALELINNSTSILPGYNLNYNAGDGVVYDSACAHRKALDEFFTMVSSGTPFVAFLGAGCSAATVPVAEIAHYWNFPTVSYSSLAPQLSDRSLYSSFFRTYPSDVNFVPAFVGLVRGLGWTRVFMFTEESPLFTQNERPLMMAMAAAGIYSQSYSFPSNADVAMMVQEVISTNGHNDTHIFFLNMYSEQAKALLCQCYHMNIRYPNYAFISLGWYMADWFLNVSDVPCTSDQIKTQLERVLIIRQLPVALNNTAPTASGLSVEQFYTEYYKRLNNTGYETVPEATTAFDAMWALALALDKVQRAVCTNDTLGCDAGPLTQLENYTYYNEQVECMLNKTLNLTGFQGVSGYVEFDVNGTRVLEQFTVFQYQRNETGDIERVLIGAINLLEDARFVYMNESDVWPDGIPPDGTEIKIINTIHVSLIVIFYTVAILGLVFAVACLAFNFYFRNKKIIKLTSPNLNYTIGGGSIIMYSSIFFLLLPGTDEYSLNLRCFAGYWLLMIGYTVAFSAVLAKMWRVYYIFHNPTTNKRTLRDWHLLIAVAVITSIVILVLIIGESIPETRHTPTLVDDKETSTHRNEYDVVVRYCVYSCYRNRNVIGYQAVIMAFLFLLQVIGIFLAFQTRKVKVKVLNDAKQVTAIVYVTSVCVVLIIMTTFALEEYLNINATLYCFSISLATTIFLMLIFIPKMHNLRKDPHGENIFTASAPSMPPITGIQPGNSFSARKESLGINMALAVLGDDPKATIAMLQAKIIELEEELKNSKEENTDAGSKRGSILPGIFSSKASNSNHSNRQSLTDSRGSITIDTLKSKSDSTSPPPNRDSNGDIVTSVQACIPPTISEGNESNGFNGETANENTQL